MNIKKNENINTDNSKNDNVETIKKIKETIERINEIDEQINNQNCDREKTIEALIKAKNTAIVEITGLEIMQGGVFIPWENFPTNDLYNKLLQYREGLILHGAAIAGKEIFNRYLK